MPEPDKTKEYKQGRQARLDRKELDSCPYGSKIHKTLWKAGWNDTDKEINKRMGC
ncbi:ribosome modulation factor [Entomomonas moraniae]|uniref:ribosome modulation factor n=1 Tax=Entomomonas moraniae TaxID=2213226 RepID=UPI0013DE829D|nr:hypothetical protein [Entomomonas moraniae]